MKKKLLNLSICTFIVLNFTGCFGESVSCSGKAENELVKEKTIPMMKEYMIAQLLNEKKDGNGMKYFFLKKATETYGVKPDLSKEFKDLPEIEAEVEKEFTNLIFVLGETRTLSKNTELNSVPHAANPDAVYTVKKIRIMIAEILLKIFLSSLKRLLKKSGTVIALSATSV